MLGERGGQKEEKEVVLSGQQSESWARLKPYGPTDYRKKLGQLSIFGLIGEG